MAIFAGPRLAEQAHMRLEDVHLDDGYLRVRNLTEHTTKTGRERRIPIEKTVFKPILEDYMKAVGVQILITQPVLL